MYTTHVNALMVKALRDTFDADFPQDDFRNIKISTEYPALAVDYPGIWVTFEPTGALRTAGIGHVEHLSVDGGFQEVRRWRFAGRVSLTVMALSGLERYRLFDELVKVIAFSQLGDERSTFRTIIEQHPLVQLVVNWDEIDQSGFGASQGTPWGSDEIIYEATAQIEVIGEFISDLSATIVPFTGMDVFNWIPPTETDPTTPGGWIS
jgi:hypothetical protein